LKARRLCHTHNAFDFAKEIREWNGLARSTI
jgi:hypothetical protein